MLSELIQRFTMTVSQLNEYANRLLMNDELLQGVLVAGEVSNFRRYPSGHWYFSLKDEQSTVRCVMFKQNNRGIPFEPQDGMHITVGGYASIYLRDGSFQLYVQTMTSDGAGALYEQYEKLKQRLAAEGLFDAAHKKEIPRYPKRIGVVTSSAGAVIRDIIEVSKRRNPHVDILLSPVSVQGKTAAQEITKSIELLNQKDDIDVIIIGRGGGSIEDLWAFNEEAVAYAIFQSRIPIISAVGHETDTTISDYVADLRAPTPSAAAELAVPLFDAWLQLLDANAVKMQTVIAQRLLQQRKHCDVLMTALGPARVSTLAAHRQQRLLNQVQRIKAQKDKIFTIKRQHIDLADAKLQAYSIQSALNRGYAVVLDEASQKAVTGTDQLAIGQGLDLIFKDGRAGASVKLIERRGEDYV